jgi:AcrR family transcriptional regulator
METLSNTEKIIIDAATIIFTQKGYSGARMQEIADLAGINKALLHYYFRNKKKLFEKIFENVFTDLKDNLLNSKDISNYWKDAIDFFIEKYIEFFRTKPFIPQFLIQESYENSSFLSKYFDNENILQSQIIMNIKRSIKEELNKDIPIIDLMLNIVSLCIFPIIAKPVIKFIVKIEDKTYDDIIENRKKTISKLIINYIENYKD